jgi:two-component system sensor histidine kinase BaeS
MRRLGCFFGLGVLALAGLGLAVTWSLATALGLAGGGGPARWVAVALLAALVVALGFLARAASRLAVPVGEMIAAARRVEGGDYEARIEERGPGQVRSVARAFNAMSARLEADDRRRRQFLADVTHELRTPLSVIRAQTEAITDGVYPADAAHLAPVLEATRTLERLVEDLRTLALAEAGALQLARERVDVADLLSDVAASHRAAAEEAGIALSAGADAASVSGDPTRLRGVLDNLVTNALRHTPAGGSVGLRAGHANESEVWIEVADTGSGIAAELLPHVFDRFTKSANSPGSGLGLAIAREVVQAHGGELTVESEAGQGSRFRFRLPVSPP